MIDKPEIVSRSHAWRVIIAAGIAIGAIVAAGIVWATGKPGGFWIMVSGVTLARLIAL